jgi:hypothetical protein
MANQTVTTAVNYDDASVSGLLNGETITINSGGSVTINSDVRWGQNAAVLGVMDVNDGELRIDGRDVWWVPFSAATGNVPALGVQGTPDVTRGGSNVGEYLGIWTALGAAPSAPGGAMPATGWIKLRRRSATLAANDVLTFAGGATATLSSAGQRGWIHVVGVEGTGGTTGIVNIPRLGALTVRGDWFDLGTASGVSGQTVQHYVADFVSAVQIETAAGSGVYEWWGCAPSAEFNATNIATDGRGRYFTCSAAGVITFGGATFGRLPPSGARIRVPNVHFSSSTSANWSANTFNTVNVLNRYEFLSTGGVVDVEFACANTLFGARNASLYRVKDSCGADSCWAGGQSNATSNATALSQVRFENVAASRVGAINHQSFAVGYSTDVEFKGCESFQAAGSGTATGAFNVANCVGVVFDSCEAFNNKSVTSWTVSYSSEIVLRNCVHVSGAANVAMALVGCAAVEITNIVVASLHAATGTRANYAIQFINCADVAVDGLALFPGTLAFVFTAVLAQDQTTNIRIRNIGTRAAPMVLGADGRYVAQLVNVKTARVSRVYFSGGSQAADSTVLTQNCDEVWISDCGDPTAFAASSVLATFPQTAFIQRTASGGNRTHAAALANGTTPTTFSTIGLHFAEQEVSATEAMLSVFTGIDKSPSPFSQSAYVDDVGTIRRDGTNGLLLRALDDQVTWTWPYWIRGLTGFSNTAPVVSGTNTANIALTYDLDKGTGFSGTFKTLNTANLSAETGISPSGVKIRLRARCVVANTGNVLRTVSWFGATSAADIVANPYPYNEPTVALSGVQSGSLSAIFRNSDGRLLDVRPSTQSRLYPAWFADANVTLRVRRPGWAEVQTPFTLTEDGAAFPLNQADTAIADTDPGALGITVTNHGASPVTWNGKQWSVTVTVPAGVSAPQVAQWLSWQTAQEAFTLGGGFHNMAWPVMVVAVGTALETQRGTLFGSTGAALKGVRVVDASDNEVPGFARMQADDGTYYSPAASYTLTVNNIVSGSRILIRRTDTSAVIANQTVSGSSFAYSYTHTSDIPVEIIVRKATSSPFYQEWRTTTTLAASNNSQTANQQLDE